MSRHISTIKWISYAVIAVSLVMLIRALPLSQGVSALRSWVEGLGIWGPVLFGLIYVVAVVAMVPASVLTLAAGATFGLVIGTITVSVASNIGAALALLIARYLARSKVEQLVRRRPRFAAIDEAIEEGGWKIVAMLRLSPVIPFNVQNYLYGLTSVGFWTCVLTSWIAMLPGTFLYVYLGHAAGSVTGGTGERSPVEWALLGVGLFATIAVTVYITRLAQHKLREQTEVDADQETTTEDVDSSRSPEGEVEKKSASLSQLAIPVAIAVLLAGLAAASHFQPELMSQTLQKLLPFGPPNVEMTEAYTGDSGTAFFDHSSFDALLREHVDDDGWVDYSALKENAAVLDAYLAALAEAPFDRLGRNDKLALLINAYNAFTLRLILDHWPLQSIKDIPANKRWSARRWNVGGNHWSLAQIEHEQIRPNFAEPRIHFALVCAAVGCPPLANEAYTAARLDEQLQRQAVYVHSQQTWLQFDRENNVARVTALYGWYGGDFLQSAPSILGYVAQYSKPIHEQLASGDEPAVEYLPYDWTINDVAHRTSR